MGAGQSTGSSFGLTRVDVLKSTEQPRVLINRLFNFFIDNFAQKDMVALANPTRCSEYIFVMADALDRLFYELRLEPGKDKKGVLLFRKSADLTRIDPNSAEGQERRMLCLSVAFFYIRIFQIYAALALSVNDDASYVNGTGISGLQAVTYGRQAPMVAPGLAGTMVGGVTNENIYKFAILKQYISRDTSRALGSFYFDKYPNLRVKINTETKNLTLVGQQYGYGYGQPTPQSISCNFAIRLSGVSSDKRLLTFSDFVSTDPSYTARLKANGPIGIFVISSGSSYFVSEKTGESIDDTIYHVMTTAQDVATGQRAPNKARIRAKQVVGGPGPGVHDVGIPEGLRTATLLASLRKVPKPLAHCIARSLQLLNVDALATSRLPAEVRTSICKVRFDASQGGIPDIGQPITNSPGINALQQLFFDKISGSKPTMSDESTGSYQTFVKTMAAQFAEQPSAPTIYLSSVVNKADKMCSSTGLTKRDKVLTVKDPNSIKLAQNAIQTLWKFQIDHDKKAIEILARLVLVEKVGTGLKISLNPLILKTGNPGIAIIAKEARELLTKYYSNCESAFRIAAGPLGVAGSA